MYQYEPQTLKKLQNTEKEILKKFDAICQKYHIEYFVVFGTALGAIRHQGFIPWDDDIDVGMLRSEYEKLKSVPKKEWEDLILSDAYKRDKKHVLIYPQLYKNGTIFETAYHHKYDKKSSEEMLPIWIDIFIYDCVSSISEVKRKYKKAHFLRKMFYYSKCGTKVYKEDSLKRRFSCVAKDCVHKLLTLQKNTDLRIYQRYLDVVAKGQGSLVTTFDTSVLKEILNSVCSYEEMFPTIRVPFEDIMVSIPKNYDQMLKQIYGDYMKLPPVEKRNNHPPKILDFGDGNGNVISE